MNYSLNQVTYELLDLYRTKITKTDDIDLREIKRWVRLQRSLWLRNEYSKSRDVDDSVEQDLGAVKMLYRNADFSLSSNSGTTSTSILISKLPIPTTIELYDKSCFTRVSPVTRLEYNLLPFVQITRFPFVGSGRFNSNQIFAFQYNSYVGVYCKGNNSLLADIYTNGLNITGVFEDFVEAARYPEITDPTGLINGFSTTKYFDDDSPAPIHDWMVQYMKNEIMKTEGNISSQFSEKNGLQ